MYNIIKIVNNASRDSFGKLYKAFCKGSKVCEEDLFNSDILTRSLSTYHGIEK